ncbi:SMI1 / KNR4 family (SUKH-1) [Paenibacillus algorifonticola]|uniref:SMI1 / KNR4 family (SUKH-1) n=1 Tax=Paenibacillus algorifonticola TaxID=684063 RepID=A0A1I2C1A8_9BACL|nr:SMI1/KNR4 family protein [Paenibacillus algorifonticola]SFE62127.1 SMI1 / KNR4 family (SUKH-1) [Paenibacillus algorifonticola]
MKWTFRFENSYQKADALSEDDLQHFLNNWNAALTEEEKQEIADRQHNPFPVTDPLHLHYVPLNPATWTFPQKNLPGSYLAFLRYSNGGEFGSGDRHFQFFSAANLREMNLAYDFPAYMPGAVSFGMDGSGNHYIWDMRHNSADGEYPIIVAHSGNLDYEDCRKIADTFLELCSGKTAADDELHS